MVEVTARRAFRYSEDGITSRAIEPGETFDCRAELVAGLRKAGCLTPETVSTPDDPATDDDGTFVDENLDQLVEPDGDSDQAPLPVPQSEGNAGGEPFEQKAMGASPENKMDGAGPETKAEPEIPANWRELPWQQLRSLASRVSDEPIRDKEDAIAAIDLEIERRG